jgi:hypothetical protein
MVLPTDYYIAGVVFQEAGPFYLTNDSQDYKNRTMECLKVVGIAAATNLQTFYPTGKPGEYAQISEDVNDPPSNTTYFQVCKKNIKDLYDDTNS